ncbi:hypothetical protein E4U41_007009 [Claviceps citrina]|nr:hypothetical protein E4U41_007009 [Claviceps citrina]
MTGPSSRRDVEDILEDTVEQLTIQKVMLESMRAESWPGIELERQEVVDNIERLKDKIRLMRFKLDLLQSTNGPEASRLHAQETTSLAGPSTARAHLSPGTPVMAAGRSSQMATTTPQGDGRGLSSPPSMRNVKRNVGEADLDSHGDRVKSRRTTPIKRDGHVSASSEHSARSSLSKYVDLIDLTGDDVDLDAYCVSQQLAQDKQRQQEQEDRLLAMRLSSNQSPGPLSSGTPSSSSNTESAPPSAFYKLMETQRLNAGGQADGAWGPSPFAFVSAPGGQQPTPSSTAPSRMKVPGAYPSPSGWDASLRSATGTYSLGTQQPQSSQPRVNPYLPSNAPSPMPASSHQRAMPAVPGHAGPSPSMAGGPRGNSMSRIIAKTSMHDFANGLDAFGFPLSDRLARFLDDEDDSPATGKDIEDLLKNIRPDIDIPEHSREVGPEGLKYPLYRHQGVALAWMKKMEEGTNKGGILADDMGLGKTISTLSLMLSNPAQSRPKTNLIIGPLSLIRQWEEEIAKKTKSTHRLSVFVYHGRKSTTEELLRYDVVLTTYGTIAQELKRLEQFIEDNEDRNIDFNDRACALKFPLLHPGKASFYRVILDEAQCIKNRNTKTAKACHHLKSTYRWCLTGTPMMNGVLELFSLLKFLQIKPYNSWDHFRQAFGVLFGQRGDPKSQAMDRLRALLKAVMLRRKKNSQLDGKPILVLPPKTEHVVYAELSTDERDFYKQLEEQAQVLFSKYLREGSVGKNYSSILVLLLRLRQACCHPHLNLDVDDAATSAVAGSDEDVAQLVKNLDQTIIERIKALDLFECPICYDVVQSPLFFIPCGHDSCKDCLTRISDSAVSQNIHEGHESNKAKCPVCRGAFNPQKCFTYDLFRKMHMPESVEAADAGANDPDDETDSGEDTDSSDDSEDEADEVDNKGNLRGFVVDDDCDDGDEDDDDHDDHDHEKPDDDLEGAMEDVPLLGHGEQDEQPDKKQKKNKARTKRKRKGKGKGKGKGKDKKLDVKPSMLKSLRLEAAKNRDAYKKYMRYLRKTWMPAAKVSKCMDLLSTISQTGDKTIVFSQWTLLLDLLEVAMRHEKLPHRPIRYDGSMTGDQRSGAAQTFRNDPGVRVMLVSLRAGNAGLNLTAANRVIIMDPFWNPYIEMQAIDRTYRIGQQREVHVYRILTQQTVEDRIVQLQEKKKEIVEAALDETESIKIGRLNVNELKFLFNTSG